MLITPTPDKVLAYLDIARNPYYLISEDKMQSALARKITKDRFNWGLPHGYTYIEGEEHEIS